MNITLHNPKINDKMSEETLCFTADLKLDGEIVGEVLNRGNGGCNIYHWFKSGVSIQFQEFTEALNFESDIEKDDQFIFQLLQKHFAPAMEDAADVLGEIAPKGDNDV